VEDRGESLLQLVREDLKVHGSVFKPGFQAVALHRVGVWRFGLPTPARKLVSLLHRPLIQFVQSVYGIEISPTASLGRRVGIPHGGKIVIAGGTVVGDDCIIRHNVTIGAARRMADVPTLGKRVAVGTGAVILGKIELGDYAEIGPNAVVLTDVPARGTVFADPGRVVVAPKPAWDDAQALREASEDRSPDSRRGGSPY
jgi:serine O-acetyltransferase